MQPVAPVPTALSFFIGNRPRTLIGDVISAELPPFEPFRLLFMPTPEPDETFGFNTEEPRGMLPGAYDPMTVTVNLAAVADLFR